MGLLTKRREINIFFIIDCSITSYTASIYDTLPGASEFSINPKSFIFHFPLYS